ncbi:MAG: suppressor of fused domain protein [Solobacterium sp.]|nr:suppressor of fused domain protein [Solobacterium sp.]
MKLTDLFRKKEKQPLKVEFNKEGWDAIDREFLRVYPGQTSPLHYMTLVKWKFGGNDPLDGVSVYDGGTYWHFVSYGLSELYDKESDNPEVSGYGYELTFKLKKDAYEDEQAEIKNIVGIMQMVARLTFAKGEIFRPDEYLYTGQAEGTDAFQKSKLTGFITIADPTVNTIDTPNGKVEFLELVGCTDAELKTLSDRASVRSLMERIGSDVTDYRRASVV